MVIVEGKLQTKKKISMKRKKASLYNQYWKRKLTIVRTAINLCVLEIMHSLLSMPQLGHCDV